MNILSLISKMISSPQHQATVPGLAMLLTMMMMTSQESQMISDLLYRVTALGLVMFFKTRTKNGKHRTWNVDVIDEWVGALIKEQTKRAWT
ncbi:hypothetical protein NC652_013830 [Populus alba x Populus x berolinensis]|nr:hypothetical protein NC652_013830 [Populus alba x Populus x berolinensis]